MREKNDVWTPQDDGTWHEKLRAEVLADPEIRAEYDAFGLQLALAEKMKKVRTKAHLTQDRVAESMETNKTVIARLEAAGGRNKHAPSITTLAKYAHAVGCHLEIKFVREAAR